MENKFINEIRRSLPDILAYIFDIMVQALHKFDEIEDQIKPNHRLGDFVIWGEAISRVIGNKDNEFLEAWKQNIHQQNVNVIQNNALAALIIDYVFNHHYDQIEIKIEPTQLFTDLKKYAMEKQLDVSRGTWFPQTPVWLGRKLRTLKADLKAANIAVNPDLKEHQKRWIYFKKITTHNASIDRYNT